MILNLIIRNIFLLILLIGLALQPLVTSASEMPLSVFPLENYEQDIDKVFNPSSEDYDTPILNVNYQQERLAEYFDHTYSGYSETSPWSVRYIEDVLRQEPQLIKLEKDLINQFSNQGKNKESSQLGYGANFRKHSQKWISDIARNVNISQFEDLSLDVGNFAIATTNLDGRLLPTDDPHFYHYTEAGQGYPFDNLQMSSLWVGTPVYILAESRDKNWYYVITPSFFAWVHSSGIARTDKYFMQKWRQAASSGLAAVTQTNAALTGHNDTITRAFVGAVFPIKETLPSGYSIYIPQKGRKGSAEYITAYIGFDKATKMPMPLTKKNMAKLIKAMINRPYGWGGG